MKGMKPLVIGISGYIGVGKDTLATHLVTHYGFTRHGMADALKKEVQANFPRLIKIIMDLQEGVPESVEDLLWVLKPPGIRELLQEYGTEVRRRDNPYYWCDQWLAWFKQQVGEPRVVIPDIRFQNERTMVHALGGKVIRVERPGYTALDGAHASEAAQPSGSVTFHNAGTIPKLWKQFDEWWEAQQ